VTLLAMYPTLAAARDAAPRGNHYVERRDRQFALFVDDPPDDRRELVDATLFTGRIIWGAPCSTTR
jgi:hypothetical protein